MLDDICRLEQRNHHYAMQHTASPEGPRGWGVDCPEAYNFLCEHMQVAKSNIYMQHYHREAGVLH